MTKDRRDIKEIRLSPSALEAAIRRGLAVPAFADVAIRTDEGVVKEAVIRWEEEE